MTREERIFWGGLITLIVTLLLIGLGLALRRSASPPLSSYLPDESRPENVVYNAYVAARRGDIDRFLAYFTEPPWKGQPPGTRIERLDTYMLENGELRVGEALIEGDKATVTVTLIRQWSNGPFGSEISVETAPVFLVREGNTWRITRELPFVYPIYTEMPIPVPPPSPGGD